MTLFVTNCVNASNALGTRLGIMRPMDRLVSLGNPGGRFHMENRAPGWEVDNSGPEPALGPQADVPSGDHPIEGAYRASGLGEMRGLDEESAVSVPLARELLLVDTTAGRRFVPRSAGTVTPD
jgi:hypothetical protein